MFDNSCNNNEAIKVVITNLNTLWQDYYSYRAVEIYSGKTINTKPFTCEYIVGLNTGKKLRVHYQVTKEASGHKTITVDLIAKLK